MKLIQLIVIINWLKALPVSYYDGRRVRVKNRLVSDF